MEQDSKVESRMAVPSPLATDIVVPVKDEENPLDKSPVSLLSDPQPSSSSQLDEAMDVKQEVDRVDFMPQPSSSTSPSTGEGSVKEEKDIKVKTSKESGQQRNSAKSKGPTSGKGDSVRSYANGSLQQPTGGKPLMAALTKKLSKPRGRPKRKALVKMYQSEVSCYFKFNTFGN